jgi:hypothetical protein
MFSFPERGIKRNSFFSLSLRAESSETSSDKVVAEVAFHLKVVKSLNIAPRFSLVVFLIQ